MCQRSDVRDRRRAWGTRDHGTSCRDASEVTLSKIGANAPAGDVSLADAASLPADEVLVRPESSLQGLSTDDALVRLGRFGSNVLSTHRVRAIAVFYRQVRNPTLVLLLGAALVSGLTGGGTNAVIITAIVVLSVGLGFFNEYRAEAAMTFLRARCDRTPRSNGIDGRPGSR